jgi:RNA polymerase sigma factor (sigma-70 family)
MNVHFSYKISKTSDLEQQINQQTAKLGKYLQVFRPELVHLKGIIEENSAREGVVVSLNLRLPSGQMAAQENSPVATTAIKAAFDDITEQLKKHKELLRHQYDWPRRRGPGRAVLEKVPFEQTVAAVHPETISASDVAGYLDINLPRLQRFIERELEYRESQGMLERGELEVADVVGEAVANALGEPQDRPERLKLEAWVHRLAKQAIDSLASQNRDEGHIPLERSHGTQNVQATDEAVLQFHQPDERLFEENVIPDPAANNPEDLAERRELISLVEANLRQVGREEREAFILFTIEGFTAEEIADIAGRSTEEVRTSIRKAREHLQQALPAKDVLKDKLVEYSKSA